ncbi:MAG: hypothetical protein WCP92_06875 [bacterium]
MPVILIHVFTVPVFTVPVVSALVGKVRRRTVVIKAIHNNFLFMRKIYI